MKEENQEKEKPKPKKLKKPPKKTRAITCSNEVWDNAKALGINISQTCEDYLRDHIKVDSILLENISYCKLCNKNKDIIDMYKFLVNRDIRNKSNQLLTIYIFICKDCFIDVKHKRTDKFDQDVLEIVQENIKSEQEDLNENKKPELIERVKKGEVRFYEPFEQSIGVYDGKLLGENHPSQFNDIKSLIKEIKEEYPFADWKIEKGKISVPLADINEEYIDNA